MANNCLVTKLKEIVDNDNLIGLYEMDLEFWGIYNGVNDWVLRVVNSQAITLKILTQGAYFRTENGENLGQVLTFNNGDSSNLFINAEASDRHAIVRVNCKNTITKLYSNAYVDFDWNCWTSNTDEIYLYDKIRYDGKYDKYDFGRTRPFTRLTIHPDKFAEAEAKGVRSYLPNLNQFSIIDGTGIALLPIANAGVIDFAGITSLIFGDYDRGYSGTIESFVAAARNKCPEHTTDIEVKFLNYSAGIRNTFNGQELPNTFTLSWTASTITCNGVTINA